MKLVTDDFYEDPDRVRELALNLKYSTRAKNLPGVRSTRTVIPDKIKEVFSSILRIKIDDAKNSFSANGCFQMMFAKDFARAYVHADLASWAAIVYLSKNTVPDGGTLFFEHKLTGLRCLPSPEELSKEAQRLGLKPKELMVLLQEDGRKKSKWREIDQIGFVYNRFVLYDARLFHRNGRTWGNAPYSGRLTHNFFAP
jgi:hypothetical protein